MNYLSFLGGVDRVTKIVTYAVIAIVLYFSIRYIIRKIKRRDAGRSGWVDPTGIDPTKNYDNIAKAVSDAFDNIVNSAQEMEDVGQQINALSNNEILHVNNRYLTLYGKNTRTLQDAMSDYWVCFPCSNLKAVLDRLKTLNIN